ncbi:MAG: hypothetical protein KGL77_01445 [Actinomycetales bacterium]|nr:hypothetical protein [Actinomycetales bacterium]
MTTVNRLGWRNFVSGVLAVLVGLIPVYIYCLLAAPVSAYTAATIGWVSAIGLVFGVIIGAPLELFVVHKYQRGPVAKTILAYLVAGAAVDVAVCLFMVGPSIILQPSHLGGNALMAVVIFLMIFIVYAVVAVIARLSYPLIHRLLWRVRVPYDSPVVAADEASTDY